jgi:hypothetical protein
MGHIQTGNEVVSRGMPSTTAGTTHFSSRQPAHAPATKATASIVRHRKIQDGIHLQFTPTGSKEYRSSNFSVIQTSIVGFLAHLEKQFPIVVHYCIDVLEFGTISITRDSRPKLTCRNQLGPPEIMMAAVSDQSSKEGIIGEL